jgi:plasmid rolling circle replication initiator protein Rep
VKDHSKFILKNQVETGEILSDNGKSGKERHWKKYKEQSLAVSEAYRIYEELVRYGENVASCGSYLRFQSCPQGHEKKLIEAYFCRTRLCPMCQWRKSLVMFHQVLALVHSHRAKYTSDIPLLLTLTVPNAKADELKSILDKMQKSWDKLAKRAVFKHSVRSWFRALEVTYNAGSDTYHPHYHILLLVPMNYFKRSRGLYISRNEWLSLWQEVTGMRDITQVDIRRVRKQSSRKPLEAISAEVAKYATKPSSYIEKSPQGVLKASEGVIKALHYALKGRRLVAFGGLFNALRKTLRQEDVEEASLIQITDEVSACQCSVCQSSLIDELYRWHIGLRQYVG